MEVITRDHVLEFAKSNKILNDFKKWVDDSKQSLSPRFTLKWIKIEQVCWKKKSQDTLQVFVWTTDKTTKNFILGNCVQPNIRAQY